MSLLADATIRASIVLLIGLLLRAALRRRSSALRHAVLAAAIVAAPFVGFLGRLLPAVTLPAADAAPMATAAIAPGRAHAVATRADSATAAVGLDTRSVPASGAGRPLWPAVAVAAVAIWGMGAVFASTILLGAAIRLRRVAAQGVEVDDPRWRRALEAASHDAGVARPVRLLVTPDAALLATWGWLRPRILIPAGALEWSDERIQTVLAHEIAHVRRGDWMLQSFAEGLRALLWWNPAAWIACRALRDDSELACDDAVLRSGVGATAYAEHLLKIAHGARRPTWSAAVVMPMARRSTLERRIVAMLNPDLDRRAPTRLALMGTAAALLLLLLPVAVLRGAQSGRQPLEGVIYDTTGGVLPGVTVTLDAETAKVQTTTDPSGRFRFDGVGPGQHALHVAQPGFRALRQPIQLQKDADWSLAVTLQVGELKETVTVSQRRPASITPLADGSAGPKPVRVGGNIRAPRKTHNVNPTYPTRMVEAGLEGQISVEAVIGADGRVVRARALTVKAHPELAQAAVDAVQQWRFEPTLLNGAPVDVVMTVTVNFSLE